MNKTILSGIFGGVSSGFILVSTSMAAANEGVETPRFPDCNAVVDAINQGEVLNSEEFERHYIYNNMDPSTAVVVTADFACTLEEQEDGESVGYNLQISLPEDAHVLDREINRLTEINSNRFNESYNTSRTGFDVNYNTYSCMMGGRLAIASEMHSQENNNAISSLYLYDLFNREVIVDTSVAAPAYNNFQRIAEQFCKRQGPWPQRP